MGNLAVILLGHAAKLKWISIEKNEETQIFRRKEAQIEDHVRNLLEKIQNGEVNINEDTINELKKRKLISAM